MTDEAVDRLIASLEESPVIDKSGYSYFVHPLSDGIPEISLELLEDTAESLTKLLPPLSDFDLILTAEAMGIPIATIISLDTGKPFSIARKRRYDLPGEVSSGQVTGYSKNELYLNLPREGGSLVIVDDVLSTGGTLKALKNAIDRTSWEIVSAVVLFNKMADATPDLEEILGFPIVSLLDVIKSGEGFTAEVSSSARSLNV
ncbi:MAG: adenine phosphoribosyltransferase [Thermoplasmatota archaeon]